jgi:Phage integrase, N-terminal SAM-like domain
MPVVVACKGSEGWRLEGSWPDAEVANRFLAHLATRAFSPATVRAYAYDLVNFGRFCVERGVRVADAVPTDFFDYLEWQGRPAGPRGARVVQLAARRPAAATMNRRIAAVRALFELPSWPVSVPTARCPRRGAARACALGAEGCSATCRPGGSAAVGGWSSSPARCPTAWSAPR